MGKIATDRGATRKGFADSGEVDVQTLASGDGWCVKDIVCSRGPSDEPFEENHHGMTIAIVTAGTFQYRRSGGGARSEMMTPGSFLLGNSGQCYECSHEHAAGDRCVSFTYTQACFESIMADVDRRGTHDMFKHLRLPPLRVLSSIVAHARAVLTGSPRASWEELSVTLAAQVGRLDAGHTAPLAPASSAAISRITRAVRMIERRSREKLTLAELARCAKLSPFHFLRTFEELTGVTPHQYLVRARLREAATRLECESDRILDIALDSGFADVSNFNHAFRREFGVSPRAYRRSVP